MKFTLIGGVALFIAAVVVGLAQLWLTVWSPEVFIKTEITIAAVFAVLVAVWFTRREYKDYKSQKNNAALDE